MLTVLQVAAGGAAGAVLRYAVVSQSARLLGTGFPFGTLAVNVLGSFLMGVAVILLANRVAIAPLFTVGLLGGFTTFSAFSLDVVNLVRNGQIGDSLVYVAASVLCSIAALALGLWLARGMAA